MKYFLENQQVKKLIKSSVKYVIVFNILNLRQALKNEKDGFIKNNYLFFRFDGHGRFPSGARFRSPSLQAGQSLCRLSGRLQRRSDIFVRDVPFVLFVRKRRRLSNARPRHGMYQQSLQGMPHGYTLPDNVCG